MTAGTTLLDHDVIDAELSEGLWSVVTVSRSPTNALYIYDVGTKLERKVPLPTPPVAVSVDRSGLMAAVAYDGHVSWVDLTTGTVKVTCGLGSNAYDVALSTSGVAYVVPLTDQWVSLHAVDLKTCKESTGSTIRAASHIVLHPNEAYAFTADQGLSPSRVHRCALKPIDCVDAEGSNDWGTRAYCGNLWASTDGTRIYTACGATLSLPFPLNSALASYGGTLANEPYLQHLSDAPAADGGEKVVLVPQVGYGGDPSASNAVDTKVTIHDVPFLGLAGSRNLTSIGTDGGSTAAHGRFVFTTPTMSALFVVVQNGAPDAGVQFGIETLLP